MKKLTLVAPMLFLLACGIGCATAGRQSLEAQKKPVRPIYVFKVTTWQETTFKGIAFYVKAKRMNEDQGFLLCCREGNIYRPEVGHGYLNQYGIVWIDWILYDGVKTKPQQTLTFELYLTGKDVAGITEVSLLGDRMFDWIGDDPMNPPEE